ncbi:MAG: PSD1 and planctomycete cytochrome C domain-containing protein [Gemmataceae bacterium]
MIRATPLLFLCVAIGFGADAPKLPPASTSAVDFEKDVRPLLAKHCVKCHGAENAKGGLRVDDRKHLLEGGNSGPVLVEKKSEESRLIHAVAAIEADLKMPPDGPALSAAEVGILRAWIDQGAKWGEGPIASSAPKSNHWAFQPIKRPAAPDAAEHPIDAFIRFRLAKEGMKPSREADKATLLRRVTLDLIGFPPTPKEVDAFLEDNSSQAYEKVVDRLLASPHFGERWGRHWLDAARYADSDGYEKDTGRPFAWRYRDWVIKALNDDLPFDRFTIEQLAGDLLPNATLDQKIATGFHRQTLTNKEGGVDQEEFRVAACVDRVNTTGKVWLGLTVGCCQCHDHKYDPISQREFYQLFAYFNSDREVDHDAPLPTDQDKKSISKAMTLAAGPVKPTHVMIRGDFLRKGVEVKPGTPRVVSPGEPGASAPGVSRLDLAKWIMAPENPLTARVTVNWAWSKLFGRGIVSTPEDFGTQGAKPSHPELLDWLASEFKTPAKPTDGRPWALKRLLKLIVTSATYRQSSAVTKDHLARDPLNVLLARQSRLRLEAEIIRDSALAASGLLNRTVGGPSIRPPQPAGISELTYANSAKWVESAGPEKYKRGLYIWFQRTSPYPMLTAFDSPDGNLCTVRRERSNTPLQALTMLNDFVFVEAAQALAKRVLAETMDTDARIALAFALCLGRKPTREEFKRLAKLLKELHTPAKADPPASAKLLGSHKPDGVPIHEAAAWVGLCRTILNLDEFVTRE